MTINIIILFYYFANIITIKVYARINIFKEIVEPLFYNHFDPNPTTS